MPKVSVILTSFNHAKYLREAIDSVLNQSFTDFELIIWDDASTDDSWKIIQSYSDPRIKSFRNDEQRRGVYGINKAISEVALGEYIAIHHSDDVWVLDKLSKQVEFLDAHADIGAVFTNALVVDEDGRPFNDEKHFYFRVFNQHNKSRFEWLRHFFIQGNALCHPSILIRKVCYENCGLYRIGLAQLGDFDMWIRLCLKYEIHVLPEKLVRFRVRDKAANASGDRPETRSRGVFEFYLLLSNYLKIDRFEDLILIFQEARKYYDNENPCVRYAVAMTMLELRPFRLVVQFSLQVLFGLLNDTAKNYPSSFSSTNFIKMTAELDPMQELNLERLNQAVAERDQHISILNQTVAQFHERLAEADGLRDQLNSLKTSFSWKITAPFRMLWR